MNLNKDLLRYIDENIFPSYKKNDFGHNLDHIKYVIDRSLKFASEVDDINYDMVYTIAAYHDIGHFIDAKNHEKISANMLAEDKNLRNFFTDEEIKTMSEAVYDHRASMEGSPRSIYGKIISSADRNTLIDVLLKRTYAYRVEHNHSDTFEQIVEDARQYIINKFGKKGYATEKMYFEDLDYKRFLENIAILAENKEEFKKKYFEVNNLNNKLKLTFDETKRLIPNMSLDEILYTVYDIVKDDYNMPFDVLRNMILEANNIDELEYYTKNVRQDLKDYILKHIFPEYNKNDDDHNINHILDVIRRIFALNDTFKLGLNDNMIYAIASCHDLGKYENNETHHLIAAKNFMNDEGMKNFFTDEERQIIKEAIEDLHSSKENEPRSVYGKLISSADKNTRIEIEFVRSFLDTHKKMSETNTKEYDEVNHITSIKSKIQDEQGKTFILK